MKFFKYCYFAAAIWVFAFFYLQLAVLPGLRNCVLENEGVSGLTSFTSVINALNSCSIATLLAASALLAITSATIVLIELRKNYFAKLYRYLEDRKKEWVIVAATVALGALPYLSSGNVFLGDAMHFSALTIYMKQAIGSLSIPTTAFYWHMGASVFAFYGWLYFLVSGIVNLFIGIDWTNKLLFLLLHIGSALLAYKFVKTATKNGKAAIIAALVYGLSFEHIAKVMIGRSFTSLTYFLIPLLFLIYELRLNKKLGINKSVALIAITSALLVFNHPANAVFILAIFALYALLKALEKDKKLAVELVISFALAFVLASFWAVPMIAEGGEASGTSKALDVFRLHAPEPSVIRDAVLWPGKWGLRQIYYLGISALALSALGLFYLVKTGKTAIAAATIAAVMLLTMQTTRHAPAMLLLLGISAGYGFMYLSRKLNVDNTKLLLVIGIIMAVDMVPATMQLGYPDFSYSKGFYDEIKSSDGERIIDLSTDRNTFWPALGYINNKAETVFGPVIESAPRSLPYAAAISNRAAQEFYDLQQNFSEQTIKGFYLLGVKYAIVHNEQTGRNPKDVFAEKRGSTGIERGLQAIELQHSPIIASKQKTMITYEPSLEKLEGWNLRPLFEERAIDSSETDQIIDSMRLDVKKGTAGQILVKESNNEMITGKEPELDVKNVKTSANKVEIEYNISDDAFLQLSYAHGRLYVKIDGKETDYWKTAINTIAVKTSAGQHKITIQGKQSTLRKELMLVSLAGLLVVVYLLRRQ